MNQPNQPRQMPSNNLPDHRQNELAEKLRRLEEQNNQLRGQIDFMAKQMTPGQKPPEESPFEPKVQQAINAEINRLIQPMKEKFEQRIGFLLDQNDDLKYRINYGNEKFQPFESKVQEIRKEYEAQGRYITREDALRIAYFEETGKKAQPEPQVKEKQEPKFDPYFQTMVDPETGLPIKDGQEPQQTQDQTEEQWRQPQQQWQQPQQQQWAPGTKPQTSFNPMMNPYSQQPQLPQDFAPKPATANRGPQKLNLSLEASDDDLRAFEEQLGDIEF